MDISGFDLGTSLGHEFDRISQGCHACILYDQPHQLIATLVPFVMGGLARNERCVVMGERRTVAWIAAALRADGVDVAAEEACGRLCWVTERAYLVDGRFDPQATIAHLGECATQAVADGFSGLRATGDLAWEMGPEPDFGLLPGYEARLDAAFADLPLTGLCQYRRCDYPPEVLRAALRSHEVVVLDTELLSHNPFHEPPQLLLEADQRAKVSERLRWMSQTLRETAALGLKRENEVREALGRQMRDRLAGVLEGMSDAFLALDHDWRVTYANAEALRIAGREAQDFLGTVLWDCCPQGAYGPVARAFRRAAVERIAVHLEHRTQCNGQTVWLDVSATPSAEGLNVFYRDITERKEAELRQTLLMREVDHRAKNALAVAQSIVLLTRADTQQEYMDAVQARISALARVHTRLAEGRWCGADLRTMVVEELEPYAADRVAVSGPELIVVTEAAQPVTMVLHELATNAAKYGALAVPEGRVTVRWSLGPDGDVRLDWREEGGPAVRPPTRQGFGSRMMAMVSAQLGGRVAFDWQPDGLCCTLIVAGDRVKVA